MKRKQQYTPGNRTVRFCIRTLWVQDAIFSHFRTYLFAAAMLGVFLSIAGVISLESAIGGITLGGAAVMLLMGALIHARKNFFSAIEDPINCGS